MHDARTGMLVAANVVKWSALSVTDATDCFVAGKITGMLLDHYKDPSEVCLTHERIRQSLKLTKHVPQLEALCSAPEELGKKAQVII